MITAKGIKEWRDENGDLHRVDGPAIERSDGGKEWYVHGERHREDDLPAIESSNRNKVWYLHGELHRENGLPAVETANGGKEWYAHDELHRVDGPAVEHKDFYDDRDNYEAWYVGGEQHRVDGPAVEYADGRKEWWVKNEQLTEEEFRGRIVAPRLEAAREAEREAMQKTIMSDPSYRDPFKRS